MFSIIERLVARQRLSTSANVHLRVNVSKHAHLIETLSLLIAFEGCRRPFLSTIVVHRSLHPENYCLLQNED
jgi:hypothetical protein